MSLARPIQLFLDFDGTITVKDTLQILARAGQDKRHRAVATNTARQWMSWSQIVDAYIHDYKAYTDSYRPAKHQRRSLSEELEWLNTLKPVEAASAKRAVEAGIFDSVSTADVQRVVDETVASGEIKIRPGLEDLLGRIHLMKPTSGYFNHSNTLATQVLSVNWSRTFVSTVLQSTLQTAGHSTDAQQQTNPAPIDLPVYANELLSLSHTSAETHLIRSATPDTGMAVELRTSDDKLRQMMRLLKEQHDNDDAEETSRHLPISIYVGDSTTDLGCLTAADVGICVRDEPLGSSQAELAETCGRVGIGVSHIGHLTGGRLVGKTDAGSAHSRADTGDGHHHLWWARDFREIDRWLVALFEYVTMTEKESD